MNEGFGFIVLCASILSSALAKFCNHLSNSAPEIAMKEKANDKKRQNKREFCNVKYEIQVSYTGNIYYAKTFRITSILNTSGE
jgi:hypothetical protein